MNALAVSVVWECRVSAIDYRLPKLDVAGSIPVSRFFL